MFVVTFSLPALAQKGTALFEQLTEKYADQDGFSASMLTNDMFDLYMKKKKVDEGSEAAAALKNLDNILVVSQSKIMTDILLDKLNNQSDLPAEELNKVHQDILMHYKKLGYTLLKTEKRMGEDVKVYLKKNGGKITALSLVTNSNTSTNLVELQGDIDLKTVAQLSQTLNLRGLENLYKIDNSSPYHGRYPPLGYNSDYLYNRMEEMVERERASAMESQKELTEEQIIKFEQQAQIQAQKQKEMAEKYRQMAETYGRQPIFLSSPGDTNTVYFLDGKKVKAERIKELDKESIESIEYTKPDKENDKTTIRITTK
jgi:DNA-binding protein H-NS